MYLNNFLQYFLIRRTELVVWYLARRDPPDIVVLQLLFGDVNKIIVKINAADVANVTLKVGNTVLTLTEVADGVYSASSDAISALNLGAKVGFNLYVGEQLVQTLTYSVNDYASRKWDDAEMGALVKALYNYGVAAAAFAN